MGRTRTGRPAARVADLGFRIEKGARETLADQIYEGVRRAIAEGRVRPGERLPSIRDTASRLSVALNTAAAAYRRLADEGFAEPRAGSGFTVPSALPVQFGRTQPGPKKEKSAAARPLAPRPLTPRARVAEAAVHNLSEHFFSDVPFQVYTPAMDPDAEREWLRLAADAARSPWRHTFYSPPHGFAPLRDIIAERLRQMRGIVCSPEQVIITTGTVQSLSLCASVLFREGDAILAEDPVYSLMGSALDFHGLRRIPVPVDREGMDVGAGLAAHQEAAGALVTPASQMALSVPLSRARREALVAWARRRRAWIIEEDTDGLTWHGEDPQLPIRSLPGGADCVIYMESFSLQIFPGLRVAYLVVPENLADAFSGAKLLSDRYTAESIQSVLAAYLASESYESHIRRLNRLCRERYAFMRQAAAERLSDFGELSPTRAGPHVTLFLREGIRDAAVEGILAARGVRVRAVSRCLCSGEARNGLILGFGGYPKEALGAGIEALREACLEAAREELQG